MPDIADWDLFSGLPPTFQVFFWVVLAITLSSGVSVLVLVVNGRRYDRRDGASPDASAADDFLWVFLVPALNEELTIADSVSRLRQADVRNRLILVINDGSDDATGAVLDSLAGPDLIVLTRVLPEARVGKAAALNNAFHYVRALLQTDPAYRRWSPDRVILGIVDADGRLSPDACTIIAPHFADPAVGGAQCRVRIYNRRHPLTWAQDIEFSSFGYVFQSGRAHWGTANMGGNGQFNRLSALIAISTPRGPWRDRLTEDQDLGVRLIQAGWRGAQVNDATIEQQGLRSLRLLYRQRTRWAQGAWQALDLLPGVARSPLPVPARVDALYYLLTPALQLTTGIGFVCAILFAALTDVPLLPGNLLVLLLFCGLGFGPGLATLLLRGRGITHVLQSIVVLLPYTVYSWLIFPVLGRSLVRQIAGRTSWAKTARESIDPPEGADDRPSTEPQEAVRS